MTEPAPPPTPLYDALQLQSRVVIDAAVFLSICRDRFEGMRLPQDTTPMAMQHYIASIRETYARDMVGDHCEHFNWSRAREIIRDAATIQRMRSTEGLPMDDIIELLGDLPYPNPSRQSPGR